MDHGIVSQPPPQSPVASRDPRGAVCVVEAKVGGPPGGDLSVHGRNEGGT